MAYHKIRNQYRRIFLSFHPAMRLQKVIVKVIVINYNFSVLKFNVARSHEMLWPTTRL